MTTLWARMLVIKAWEKGEITEKCAHYFDKLLFDNINMEYQSEDGKYFLSELRYLNGQYGDCVLKNIGINNNFNVLNYINKTSFKKGYTMGDETVYLANIINEDYTGLPFYIGKHLFNPDLNTLITIKEYLEKTEYKCCKNYINDKQPNLKKRLERLINGLSEEKNKKRKNYDKPAYTDLIDADY